MFDDNTAQGAAGAPPSNLPMGEPEDIFAGTEAPLGGIPAGVVPQPQASPAPAPSQEHTPPSALSAGILKPKAPSTPAPAIKPPSPATQAAVALGMPPIPVGGELPAAVAPSPELQSYKVQGPSFLRTALMMIMFVVIIAAVIGGAYWAYASFVKKDGPITPPVTQQPSVPTPDGEPTDVVADGIGGSEAPEEISIDDQILFGELVDSDSDGLDDEQERAIGTDPQNWDTDGDELSDYDEVAVWKTDPFSIDSDGDSYLDGAEVNNGYNPSGQGRIFEPPAPDTDAITSLGSESSSAQEGGRPATDPIVVPTEPSISMPTVISGDGKACGPDGDCFLASAAKCEKATHNRTTLLDLWDVLGVRQNVMHYLQILGRNDVGMCEWYMRIDDVEITFKEDIAPEIQAENRKALETTIGWDGTCRMSSAELAALIQKWNGGGFSSDDLKAPQCQGKIFST